MLFHKLTVDKRKAFEKRDMFTNNLLGTVITEASKESKNPSDDSVTGTLKGFVKNARTVLKNLENHPEDPRVEKAKAEIEFLATYLPSQLSGDGLRKVIGYIITLEGIEKNLKNTGAVMKALGAQYPDRYDGKEASDLAREILAEG